MRERGKKHSGSRSRFLALLIGMIVASPWLATSVCMADLVNGDFSSPLNVGWPNYDTASVVGGVAVLSEGMTIRAYIEQLFTIPAGSASLSFDYRALFEDDGAESFSASLLDPVSSSPLIATDVDPLDPAETYYFMHDWNFFNGTNDVLRDPSYVTLADIGGGWTRVTLSLADLGGFTREALIAFDLVPNLQEDWSFDAEIWLDNVSVNPVPLPSAAILGLLGLGAAYRKVRQHS